MLLGHKSQQNLQRCLPHKMLGKRMSDPLAGPQKGIRRKMSPLDRTWHGRVLLANTTRSPHTSPAGLDQLPANAIQVLLKSELAFENETLVCKLRRAGHHNYAARSSLREQCAAEWRIKTTTRSELACIHFAGSGIPYEKLDAANGPATTSFDAAVVRQGSTASSSDEGRRKVKDKSGVSGEGI